MNQAALENSILLKQFRDFYREVLKEKDQIESIRQYSFRPPEGFYLSEPSDGVVQTAAPDDSPETQPAPEIPPEPPSANESTPASPSPGAGAQDTAYPVHMRLLSLLERQTNEARRYGGEYGVTFYKEAQYVMAALADEIFLKLEWDGRESWKANLLEFKLFGTHVAGERFYRNMEALLKKRDPAMVEMAAVYLLAISLGFRGKFLGIDDEGQLAYYRNQLFTFMYHRNHALDNEARRIFPEAYDYTLGSGALQKLPHVSTWIGIIVLLLLIWLLVSHLLWHNVSDDLIKVTETIFRFVGNR